MEEHKPVLLKEVLYFLDVKPGRRFIDATIGGSGHTEAILKQGGEVLGIDVDPYSLQVAQDYLEKAAQACPPPNSGIRSFKFHLVQGNFANLFEIASKEGFKKVDGILLDLGIASFQLLDPKKGLTFQKDAPLDMRLDPGLGVTAADLVNVLPEKELYELFKEQGQERYAREIAGSIVRQRSIEPFKTTGELKELVEGVYANKQSLSSNKGVAQGKIHPATKVFMALRIAVNLEFENLKKALPQALSLLKPGGRLVVISFHSGEDRIVKQFLKEEEKKGIMKVLTKKPVRPSFSEVQDNPRARSARMRVGQKVGKSLEIRGVWKATLGLLFGVAILQLLVSGMLAGKGEELARLNEEAHRLARENQILQEELSEKRALTKIAAETERLNLAKPTSVIYLDLSAPVAALPPQ